MNNLAKKLTILVSLTAIVALSGCTTTIRQTDTQNDSNVTVDESEQASQSAMPISITGELVCLTPVDEKGDEVDDSTCHYGVKTEKEYYELTTSTKFKTGSKVSLSGAVQSGISTKKYLEKPVGHVEVDAINVLTTK